MQLARVIGNVTSIVKHDSLQGQKMLLVVPVSYAGKGDGDPSIVFDKLSAGLGDLVLISSDGRYTGSDIIGNRATPARWGIVGIVDKKSAGKEW
ncbi:MAG: EutN/CcmL family microcompartment protein [Thermoguttaceae bacterium]|jgi:ethanolamine utilization protein EutN